MRGVSEKAQQMMNQLGMSENILTLIERRSKTDLLIFFGLCILTLLFIYFLYFYVKPMLSLSYLFSSSALPDTAATNSTLANATLANATLGNDTVVNITDV